jgi:hypothetical protein
MARTQAPVGAPQQPEGDADRRQRLERVRDDIEGRMTGASDRDYASLVARYQSVLAELASLPAVKESDGIDDLAARRKARRTAASGS